MLILLLAEFSAAPATAGLAAIAEVGAPPRSFDSNGAAPSQSH